MRMGPVLLRMMRGCPEKRQNKKPAMAVPRKLSITPWGHKECEAPWRQKGSLGTKPITPISPGTQATVLTLYSRPSNSQVLLPISYTTIPHITLIPLG